MVRFFFSFQKYFTSAVCMCFITTTGLVKNTILGIVVFEIYGAIVDTFIPVPSVSNDDDKKFQASNATTASSTWLLQGLASKNNLFVPVSIHSLGGFMGGAAHGVVATFWESVSITLQHKTPKFMLYRLGSTALREFMNPALALIRQQVPGMISHHGLSHAVLFGSYDLFKRLIFSHWTADTRQTYHDDSNDKSEHHVNSVNQEPMVKVEYLAYIFLAGGFAGQAQHIASHFTERWFLLYSSSMCHSWRAVLFPWVMSFFPSGVAFVAFEYSRNV
jgi:hypothetical protein